jgi:hypothetical protein
MCPYARVPQRSSQLPERPLPRTSPYLDNQQQIECDEKGRPQGF